MARATRARSESGDSSGRHWTSTFTLSTSRAVETTEGIDVLDIRRQE